MKFIQRNHRGGLKESLETEKEISQEYFNLLITMGKYHFYGYDQRCKEYLWLLNNIKKDYKSYTEFIGICLREK